MQGRNGSPVCLHCGQELKRSGRFCPSCGHRLPDQSRPPELELPRYRKRNSRLVAVTRCGGFHHELMVHVFRFRFCPECGEQLVFSQPLPELS